MNYRKIPYIILICFFNLLLQYRAYTQNNTFPTSGNVGVGTTSPSEDLEVKGNSIIGINNIDSILNSEGHFQGVSPLAGAGFIATPWVYARVIEGDQRGSGSTLITIGGQNGLTNSDEIGFLTSGKIRMKLNSIGNFGIGTTNPTELLTVNGIIKSEEIIVEENVGADFVFEENYKLPSLSEVEQHIKTNRHLPEIPSAEEMIANGVKVGELQMKLLQKIEELTLYVIELEKRDRKKEERLTKQQAEIELMKTILLHLSTEVKWEKNN